MKVLYFLVGSGVGACVTVLTALINHRLALQLRRAHAQVASDLGEGLQATAARDRRHVARVRDKIEAAHQLLSKIARAHVMTTQEVPTGLTGLEGQAQALQSQEDVRQLQMLVALYLPSLHETIEVLAGLIQQFWGHQLQLFSQASLEPAEGAPPTLEQRAALSSAIRHTVATAKSQLQEVAWSLPHAMVLRR